MKERISKIKTLFENQYTSNKDYQKQLEELRQSKDYTEEYKKDRRELLSKRYRETADKTYADILEILTDLKASERTHVDLSDSSLINAVTLINGFGKNLPRNIINDINNSFRGNQSALSVIYQAYSDNDIYNEEIKTISYDVNTFYDRMAQAIRSDLENDAMGGLGVIGALDNWTKAVDNEPATETTPIVDKVPKHFF